MDVLAVPHRPAKPLSDNSHGAIHRKAAAKIPSDQNPHRSRAEFHDSPHKRWIAPRQFFPL